MPERHALDRHAQRVHAREVRLAALAGHVLLTESNLLGRAFLRLPLLYATLKGAQLTVLELARIAALEIQEKRSGLQTRINLELLDDLAPYLLERVLACSPRMRLGEFTGQATGALVLAGGLLADACSAGPGAERTFCVQKTKEFADDVVRAHEAAKAGCKGQPSNRHAPHATPLNREKFCR